MRRVLDHLTTIALLTTLGVAVVATVVLGREGFATPPAIAKLGIERALRRRGFAVGSGDDRSRYAPRPHDVKAAPLFDKLFPAPVVPHHGDTPIGPAVALERVVLLERATPNARATATLEKGEVVMAVKQSGEWLLVVVNEQGHTRFGWAHREQLRTMAPTMDGRR